MNSFFTPKAPLSEPADALLADIAIRVQLSPTQYSLAEQRYDTVHKWIERPGSPLEDRVLQFYTQGSMAIGATVASKLQYDEHDIDLIAELDIPANTAPSAVLDLLESAIRGERGSRYYSMVKRHSRCIQIAYEGMHLDITPMVRLAHLPERCGYIYHAPNEHASPEDRMLLANPWGFARWFTQNTPAEQRFALAFAERASGFEGAITLAEAEVEPVPAQVAAHEKSMAVIALQLLKRFRNVQYDQREGRCPPSVVLSYFVARHANQTQTLSEEVLHQSRMLRDVFQAHQLAGQLVEVRNPKCNDDIFTDRWPANLTQQGVFLRDLDRLVERLEEYCGECTLVRMQQILTELFGERPALDVVKAFNEHMGRSIVDGRSRHVPERGRFVLPTAASVAAAAVPAVGRATPRHTHFGGRTK